MAFIPVVNAARVSLAFTQTSGEFAENVFGVQRDEAWDPTGLTTVAQAVMDWWHDGDGTHSYRGFQHTGCTLLQCTARDLTVQDAPVVTVAADEASNVGTDAGTALAAGLSFALTARTGLAGRSHRGRTFLIGLASGAVDASNKNAVAAANAPLYVSAFNSLITKVHTADVHSTLVVISTRHNNAPRASGVTTPITSYGYHDLFLDYQRRRAPGHNRHH